MTAPRDDTNSTGERTMTTQDSPEAPADTLRRAARLMRERAQAATPSGTGYADGWAGGIGAYGEAMIFGGPSENGYRTGTVLRNTEDCDGGCTAPSQEDVNHICGWHPAVALAVADLIEVGIPYATLGKPEDYPIFVKAMAAARTFLGESGDSRG